MEIALVCALVVVGVLVAALAWLGKSYLSASRERDALRAATVGEGKRSATLEATLAQSRQAYRKLHNEIVKLMGELPATVPVARNRLDELLSGVKGGDGTDADLAAPLRIRSEAEAPD